MKRDPQLRSLSSDHHRALVMARKMERASKTDRIDPETLSEIKAFCQNELEPHFSTEENALLPPLKKCGEHRLVEQTLREHAEMRALAARLEQRDVLQQFSRLLKQHVRFEEKTLFEVCQEKLGPIELGATEENRPNKMRDTRRQEP